MAARLEGSACSSKVANSTIPWALFLNRKRFNFLSRGIHVNYKLFIGFLSKEFQMHRYILSIDQGTTGSTALIVDRNLEIIGSSSNDFAQHFPKPSWVEHDLNEIWASVCQSVAQAIRSAKIEPKEIAAIGLTNQRETTCAWDSNGVAAARAIVWQDRRTAAI